MHKVITALEGRVHKAEAAVATLQAEAQQRHAVAADLEARVRVLEAASAVPQAVEAEAVQPAVAAHAVAADVADKRAPQPDGEPAAKRARGGEESVMYDEFAERAQECADLCTKMAALPEDAIKIMLLYDTLTYSKGWLIVPQSRVADMRPWCTHKLGGVMPLVRIGEDKLSLRNAWLIAFQDISLIIPGDEKNWNPNAVCQWQTTAFSLLYEMLQTRIKSHTQITQ
ncbi:hypothetical protein JKP88DRAFT_353947 [Tribonema minus]|uniref:Uncharacterized protein n=1 Tax=Tribonema minus TaxID=303371 RepID=A0A835ZCR4_9STRA|nr:hypothetical protein JKP88DRAFT_353947 [Tribonema minus]